MVMLGRSLTATSQYRYGFNGKEKDNEIKGEGNQYDYGFRIYDPRIGRFLSVDPISKKYPELTPYQFASNRPIDGVDEDGLEYSQSNKYGAIESTSTKLYPMHPVLILQTNAKIDAMARYLREEIAAPNMYGNAQIGPRWLVQSNIAIQKQKYSFAIADNIAGGPFGAIGYIWKGDRGSFAGAAVDQVIFSFGGVPGEGYLSKPQTPNIKNPYVPTTSMNFLGPKLSLSKFSNLDELAPQFFFRTPENSNNDLKNNGWTPVKGDWGSKIVFEKIMGKERYYAIWEPSNMDHSDDGQPTSYWKITKGKIQATSDDNVRRVSTSLNFKDGEKK